MLTIGDFARLGELSVRMLRHYDALGLLTPAQVDPWTGYRRYDVAQLSRLNRLLALKDLGLSLEQVRAVLDEEVDAEALRGMLRLRQAQLAEQIDADRRRLADVERRLRMIEKEGVMSELEFHEKSLPALRCAQVSTTLADTSEVPAFLDDAFTRLMTASQRQDADQVPTVATYAEVGDALRVTANFPVSAEGQLAGFEQVDLPAVENALTVVHRGDMAGIGETWQALAREVAERGHQPVGPCREVYLATPPGDQSDWVTELQQPYVSG